MNSLYINIKNYSKNHKPQITGLQKVKRRIKENLSVRTSVKTPVEWAEKYRILPNADSMWPGRFSFDKVPFMREIAECFSPASPVQEVAFKKGSQVMGTTCLTENIIGYYQHAHPCNILLVCHRMDLIEKNIHPRLLRMVQNTPLAKKLNTSKRGVIAFEDGTVFLSGAAKPESFRNISARVLILEELTAYPVNLKKEGSLKELAKNRTKNYEQNRKILYISSALNNGDEMDQLFQAGDQRYYHVPCPHCRQKQRLLFENLRYEVSESGHVQADSVHYECIFCKEKIKEEHKTDMFSEGQWISESPENEKIDYRSYHLSALYSPFGLQSWAAICQQFEEARRESGDKMRVFYNTVLGENYSEAIIAPPNLQQLLGMMHNNRLVYHRGQSPLPILYATIGVDVQQDRLEVEVVGWAEEKRNFSIDYFQLYGDPALLSDESGCWAQLDKLIQSIFEQKILCTVLIDAGNKPEQIYDYLEKSKPPMTWPIMGEAPRTGTWPYKIKPVEGYAGMERLHINTPYFKRCFFEDSFQNHGQGDHLPPRYVGLPADYDIKHQERLYLSERPDITVINGVYYYKWVQLKQDNHPLDARVYAMAAAFRLREIVSKEVLELEHIDAAEVEQILKEQYGPKNLNLSEFKTWLNQLSE